MQSFPATDNQALRRGRRERIWTTAFCFVISLQVAHFVHSAWQQVVWAAPAAGTGPPAVRYAPDGYRIAIPALIGLIRRWLTGQDGPAAYAGLDFVCVFGGLLVYCAILRRRGSLAGLTTAQQILPAALFLGFVQIPLAWVTPWQRPETTPTALYVAAALFCLLSSRRRAAWLSLLCLITVWQSFVRSDVPAVLGLSILLVSLAGQRLEGMTARKTLMLCGLAMLVIAVAAQAYLQFVAFPHLSYPPRTDVTTWRDNLQRHNLAIAALVLLPIALLGVLLRLKGGVLEALDWIALTASGIYLVLWYLVGNMAEVRLYVPFLFALSLVGARVLSAWLLDEEKRGLV